MFLSINPLSCPKFALSMHPDFNFVGKDKRGNDVKIVNGQLKCGCIDKANLGQESGLMLRNIYEKYGPTFTSGLLGKISKLGITVLSRRGFSIGLADMDLEEGANEEIKEVIAKAEEEGNQLINSYNRSE